MNEGEVEAIETPRAAPPPHDLLARLILPCGQPSVEQIEQEPDPIGVDHVLLTVCGDLDDPPSATSCSTCPPSMPLAFPGKPLAR